MKWSIKVEDLSPIDKRLITSTLRRFNEGMCLSDVTAAFTEVVDELGMRNVNEHTLVLSLYAYSLHKAGAKAPD